MNKENNLRFKHHRLLNGDVLTVVTSLNHYTKTLKVGWALFVFPNNKWKKKEANLIAKTKMKENPLYIILSESEDIQTDYITLRALKVIYYHFVKHKFNTLILYLIRSEIYQALIRLQNRAGIV